MDFLFNLMRTFACVYVLTMGLVAINRMSPSTGAGVRIAFILITTGAFAEVVWIWEVGDFTKRFQSGASIYDFLDTVWCIGVAAYVWASNRRTPYTGTLKRYSDEPSS